MESNEQGLYLFTIGDDNIVNVIRLTPLGKMTVDTVLFKDVQEASLWSAEKPGEILDGVSFGGRVYDTEHLLEMLLDELGASDVIISTSTTTSLPLHLVVQHDILFFHARHESVFCQRIWAAGILLVCSVDLFIQTLDVRR